MASTAIKDEFEKLEYFDSPEVLEAKVSELAEMIQASQHMVAYTGAGISTSVGIPDYRSGVNTVISTGPGCWETEANIKKAKAAGKSIKRIPESKFNTTIQEARPGNIHMGLAELMKRGILKHIISSNIDGLHRKSGVPFKKICELHGNTNLEICTVCNKNYMRDFRVRKEDNKYNEHETGRFCDDPKCKGALKDSIINFKESLAPEILQEGFEQSQKADLHLVMGSSCRVQPAASMPVVTPMMGGKLVVINLQKTPINPVADIVIHAKIEDVMNILMKKLNIPIPAFKREMYAKVSLAKAKESGLEYLQVHGSDEVGGPYSIFRSVQINGEDCNLIPLKECEKQDDSNYAINLSFQGYYNEPDLKLKVPRSLMNKENKYAIKLKMLFDPAKSTWESVNVLKVEDQTFIENLEFKQAIAPTLAPPRVDEKLEVKSSGSGSKSPSTRASSSRRNAEPKLAIGEKKPKYTKKLM